jgi:hypothetical protein
VDEAERSTVQEKKIRVVFLPEKSTTGTPQRAINGTSNVSNLWLNFWESIGSLTLHRQSVSTPDTAPPAYRSPSPEAEHFTPQTQSKTSAAPVSSTGSKPAIKKEFGDTKPKSSTSAKESVSNAAAAVSNAVPTSVEELKAQLAQAQATIASYGKEGGLRLRKAVDSTAEGGALSTEAIRQNISEGVPVQIVAALCLLSFLLAYLFF